MAFSVSYTYLIIDKYSKKLAAIDRKTRKFTQRVAEATEAVRKLNPSLARMHRKLLSTTRGFTMASQTANNFRVQAARTSGEAVRFNREMNRSAEKIDKVGRKSVKTSTRLQRLKRAFKQTGTTSSKLNTKIAGIVSTVGGVALIRGFNNFETSINALNAVTLATDIQMQRLRKTAMYLGETTQFSASDAARGMKLLAMAGLSVNQTIQAIPKTLQLAAAGSLDLAAAADISTNVLAQMGMTVGELGRINDVLSLAQAKANFNVLQLFDAMRPTAVTAKNLGINLEQLTAVLGVMANAGEKGSIAGTLVRNALTNLAGPSKLQLKLYRRLGINLREFVSESGKIKDLKGFIGKLNELQKSGKLSVSVLQALFGERGFRAVQIWAGAGAEAVNKLERSLSKAGGTAEKMATIRMRGLPGVLLAVKSALEAVNIALFQSGLDEFLINVIGKVTTLARSTTKTNPIILKIIAFLGLATIVIGPLIIVLGVLSASISAIIPIATAIGMIFGLISAPVLAVGAAIAAVSIAINQLRANWSTLTAPGFLKDLGGFLGSTAKKVLFGESSVAGRDAARTGTLNGRIDVVAGGGTTVRTAKMVTSMPGNLGFNMGGAGP